VVVQLNDVRSRSRVRGGARRAVHGAATLELSDDVAADSLLLLFLQQKEAGESDDGDRGLAARSSGAVADGDLQNAAIEHARTVRCGLIVVACRVALVRHVLLVAVRDVADHGIGRSATAHGERRRLLGGEDIWWVLRLGASHGTAVVPEARVDALSGRSGFIAGLLLNF